MIQRIQSVYLLCYAIVCALLLFMPIYSLIPGETSVDQSIYHFSLLATEQFSGGQTAIIHRSWPLVCTDVALIAGSLLALFSYKDRKRQMLLTRVLMFLAVAFIAAIVNSTNGMREMSDPGNIFRYSAAAVLVIIPPVMAFLAFKGIKKDDALVRSADRLR